MQSMKALGLHQYGPPLDVLRLEDVPVPTPKAGCVRVRVHACGLNPADGALCLGFMPTALPRGIGLDVSGIVDAVGEGVTAVKVGDPVFGVPDFMGGSSAGAAEYAILSVFVTVPEGLDLDHAAALPMAIETATRSLDLLGVGANQTLLVNGGGTMMGFTAVQMALLRGARVIATAGETFAGSLRDLGAEVTPYGAGMVERVRALVAGAPDHVLHTAFVKGVLPDLVEIADGNPGRVLSISDFDEEGLGVRTSGREPDLVPRYDALAPFAKLAAEGRFSVPVARRFALRDWRAAMEILFGGHAHGKLLLLPQIGA